MILSVMEGFRIIWILLLTMLLTYEGIFEQGWTHACLFLFGFLFVPIEAHNLSILATQTFYNFV